MINLYKIDEISPTAFYHGNEVEFQGNKYVAGQRKLRLIQPMLAKSIDGFDLDDPSYCFQIKYDGYRVMLYKEGSVVKLLTRNYKDFADVFPEIVDSVQKYPFDLILDGEIVVTNRDIVPDFTLAQTRGSMRKANEILTGMRTLPATFMAFDILHANGSWFHNLPLFLRLSILRGFRNDLISRSGNIIRFGIVKTTERDGYGFFGKQVVGYGHEGIVAKRIDSTYKPGKRVADWIKVMPVNEEICWICGYTEIESILKDGIGALHLCQWFPDRTDNDEKFGIWKYVGKVGTGFTEALRIDLLEKLKGLPTIKPELRIKNQPTGEGNTWVIPRYKCEIRFKKKTEDGKYRHPVFKRLIPFNRQKL